MNHLPRSAPCRPPHAFVSTLVAMGLVLSWATPASAGSDLGINMYTGLTMETGYHPTLEGRRGSMAYTFQYMMIAEDEIGVAVTSEITLGGGWGGFIYNMNWGVGIGGYMTDELGFSITGGVGFSGVSGGYLPFEFQANLQAHLMYGLSDESHVMIYARPQWVGLSEERDKGVQMISMGDELQIMAIYGTGELENPGRDPDEWGPFAGLIYHENRQEKTLGLIVGFGVAQAPM